MAAAWTHLRDALLIKLWGTVSPRYIAETLGDVTAADVIERARELGLPGEPEPEAA